jgi:hypothetical protein
MLKQVILSEVSYLEGFISEALSQLPFSLPPTSTLLERVKRSLDTIKAAAKDGPDN